MSQLVTWLNACHGQAAGPNRSFKLVIAGILLANTQVDMHRPDEWGRESHATLAREMRDYLKFKVRPFHKVMHKPLDTKKLQGDWK